MALRPQVLLRDEPCSASDPISSGTVEALIRLMRGKFTIIVVTHNLAQAKTDRRFELRLLDNAVTDFEVAGFARIQGTLGALT